MQHFSYEAFPVLLRAAGYWERSLMSIRECSRRESFLIHKRYYQGFQLVNTILNDYQNSVFRNIRRSHDQRSWGSNKLRPYCVAIEIR